MKLTLKFLYKEATTNVFAFKNIIYYVSPKFIKSTSNICSYLNNHFILVMFFN